MTSSKLSSADDRTRIYEALADARRREALRVLRDADAPLALADLAAALAARGEPGAGASEEEIERILVSLYHVHVPKLEAMGIVEYDAPQRTVALSESSPPIEHWL